jgi:hypothetical protein
MTTEWLAARGFERSHKIIAAIKTLSIHSKRVMAGDSDTARQADVTKARQVLLVFLDRFHAVVRQAEEGRDSTIVGTDPRLSSLAKRFMIAKKQLPQRSPLYVGSLDELRCLLQSNARDDQERLVASLRDLRVLIEQHAHADIVGIFGEI